MPPAMPSGNEPVFDEPWQAEVFAMVVALHDRELFAWHEWSAALAQASEGEPDPWRAWLVALERMVADRTGIAADVLSHRREEWRRAAERTPHGEPIVL